MKILKNTDKVFHCTNCGGEDCNIVREGPDPKLKCNSCNFVFLGSDSKAAEEAGAIPDAPPSLKSDHVDRSAVRPNPRDPVVTNQEKNRDQEFSSDMPPLTRRIQAPPRIPRTVNYVFLSKDRKQTEFVATKDLVKTALKWESRGTKYELFELQPKKSSVKIDIE